MIFSWAQWMQPFIVPNVPVATASSPPTGSFPPLPFHACTALARSAGARARGSSPFVFICVNRRNLWIALRLYLRKSA
jgi:hypothetical protein